MNEGLQRYLDLASDVTRTTVGTTERLLAQFVRQGEVAAEHAERVVDDIVARSVEGSGAVAQLVRAEVERAVERAGLCTDRGRRRVAPRGRPSAFATGRLQRRSEQRRWQHRPAMSHERLAAAQRRLEQISNGTVQQQKDDLEFVHAALVAELDDLLERGADGPAARS